MVKTIFLKEIHAYFQDKRMLLSMCLILLLMILSGIVFSLSYTEHYNAHRELLIKNQEKLRRNKDESYVLTELKANFFGKEMSKTNTLFDLVFLEQNLIAPPCKLAIMSNAATNKIPDGIKMTYFSISNPERFKTENSFVRSFLSIDWTNIVIYFLSFIIICFSYNAFSGEKMNGTLKLMLVNKVSRWQIIMGKLLSIVVTILIPFITGILISLLIIISLNNQLLFGISELVIVLLFVLGTVIFIALNTLICFLISIIAVSPGKSLGYCLVTWVVLSIVIPNTSWLFSKLVYPVSSEADISLLEERVKKEETKGCSWSWSYKWENKPPNEMVLERARCRNITTKVHNDVWGTYRNDILNQTKTAITFTKVSPYSLFRFLGEKLSNNGFMRYRSFYSRVLNYHNVFQDFIEEEDQADKSSHHLIWAELSNAKSFMSNKPVKYEHIPQFAYKTPSINQLLNQTLVDFGVLLLLCIVLFIGVFVAFIRFDVR